MWSQWNAIFSQNYTILRHKHKMKDKYYFPKFIHCSVYMISQHPPHFFSTSLLQVNVPKAEVTQQIWQLGERFAYYRSGSRTRALDPDFTTWFKTLRSRSTSRQFFSFSVNFKERKTCIIFFLHDNQYKYNNYSPKSTDLQHKFKIINRG